MQALERTDRQRTSPQTSDQVPEWRLTEGCENKRSADERPGLICFVWASLVMLVSAHVWGSWTRQDRCNFREGGRGRLQRCECWKPLTKGAKVGQIGEPVPAPLPRCIQIGLQYQHKQRPVKCKRICKIRFINIVCEAGFNSPHTKAKKLNLSPVSCLPFP